MVISSAIAASGQLAPRLVNEVVGAPILNTQSKDRSLDDLRKEVQIEAKSVKESRYEQVRILNYAGYVIDDTPPPPEKPIRQMIVINRKLSESQDRLMSRIANLKDFTLIDSLKKKERESQRTLSGIEMGDDEKTLLQLYDYISKKPISKITRLQFSPFGNQAVDHYLEQLRWFQSIEDSLGSRMESLLVGTSEAIAEKRKVAELAEKARKEELQRRKAMEIAYRDSVDQEYRNRANAEAARESDIRSKLPSKDAVRAKYRNYTHKTGHVFEMLPVGFTPANNAGVNDYVTIFGTKYKARYRERDPSGQVNTLIIDFYDSGNAKEVTIYDQGEMIYNAKYADAASKPYEIRAYTKDRKYYSVLKREYNYDAGKVAETFEYQDDASGFWVR